MQKKDNYFLLIAIILILVSVFVLLFLNNKKDTENVVVKDSQYILLNDYSRFFTVNSCAYKYITYITSNNVDDLISVLDKDYIEKNGINSENVFNYIEKLDGNYGFESKKIFYQQIDDNYFTYYVFGYVIEDVMDEYGEKKEYYLKISMDLKNELFSVMPYDGKIFKENINE